MDACKTQSTNATHLNESWIRFFTEDLTTDKIIQKCIYFKLFYAQGDPTSFWIMQELFLQPQG